MTFHKEYSNWTIKGDERYNIVEISGHGDTLDELLDNCQVFVEDWHGNECLFYQTLGELPGSDYDSVVEEITKELGIK